MRSRQYTPDLHIQMAACDANYIRFLKLLRDFQPGQQREVRIPGQPPGEDLCFTITVVESFRYTSTISIEQHQPGALMPYYRRPEMQVRVYHDAQTAEVVSYQNHRYFRFGPLFTRHGLFEAAEKRQLNLFLGEWLALCLAKGVHADVDGYGQGTCSSI